MGWNVNGVVSRYAGPLEVHAEIRETTRCWADRIRTGKRSGRETTASIVARTRTERGVEIRVSSQTLISNVRCKMDGFEIKIPPPPLSLLLVNTVQVKSTDVVRVSILIDGSICLRNLADVVSHESLLSLTGRWIMLRGPVVTHVSPGWSTSFGTYLAAVSMVFCLWSHPLGVLVGEASVCDPGGSRWSVQRIFLNLAESVCSEFCGVSFTAC